MASILQENKGIPDIPVFLGFPARRSRVTPDSRIRVKETGCGVVWLCTLRVGCGKGGGMKRIVLLLAAMLCLPQGAAAQSQIGQDIDGEAADEIGRAHV